MRLGPISKLAAHGKLQDQLSGQHLLSRNVLRPRRFVSAQCNLLVQRAQICRELRHLGGIVLKVGGRGVDDSLDLRERRFGVAVGVGGDGRLVEERAAGPSNSAAQAAQAAQAGKLLAEKRHLIWAFAGRRGVDAFMAMDGSRAGCGGCAPAQLPGSAAAASSRESSGQYQHARPLPSALPPPPRSI